MALLVVAATRSPAMAQDPTPQPVAPAPATAGTEERIGDWTLRCLPAANGAPERCEMVQVLGDSQSQREVLLVAVGYPDGQTTPVAWVVLPLGVLLPPGIGLRIDEGETKGLPYRACDQRGCATPWPLTEAEVASLKNGNKLFVLFRDIEGKQLGLPVSLSGFTKAFARLK